MSENWLTTLRAEAEAEAWEEIESHLRRNNGDDCREALHMDVEALIALRLREERERYAALMDIVEDVVDALELDDGGPMSSRDRIRLARAVRAAISDIEAPREAVQE